MLLIPEVVELDADEAERWPERPRSWPTLGLVLEAFGPGAVMVREVPALLGETDVNGLVRDLARDDLAETGEAPALLKERLEAVCSTMACHGSVRAGRRLTARGDERAAARDGGNARIPANATTAARPTSSSSSPTSSACSGGARRHLSSRPERSGEPGPRRPIQQLALGPGYSLARIPG